MLTSILIANTTADTSTGRASRASIGSRSSEDSASSLLQNARGLTLQHPPTGHQSFPINTTNLNASQAYNISNIGVNRYPMGPSYAANMYPVSFDSDHPIPLSAPGSQTPSYTVQPSCSTMTQRDPIAQSSTVLWGAPVVASGLTPSNLPYSIPATMNPPQQLDYTFSLSTPYRSGNSHNMHYNTSPYSSPSSEQGTPYSKSTGSSYIGETGQRNNWSEQPPAKPQ
jgi:hypothetical protein